MKKLTFKTLLVMLMCACMTLATSCSKKDKKHLLSTVPANTVGLMIVDASAVWDQLEINVDGDDVSYCKEIKEIISLSGVKKSDIDTAIQTIDGTDKSAVIFEYEEKPFVTFYVKDGKDFMKMLEDEASLDFDEEDGFQVTDHIAIKGDQVWITEEDVDTDALEKFLDLDKEKRFYNKYEQIAETMLADDVVSAFFLNIDNFRDLFNNSNDSQAFGMVQSMCFKDAAYIVGISKLTDSAITSEVRVLNEKGDAAEFLLPMAEINGEALSKINNNAPFILAGAINPELTEKFIGLVEKFGGVSSSDEMIFNYLKALSGTFGFSFANSEDGVGVINFSNSTAPTEIGTMLGSEKDFPFELTTVGNALICRLPGTPAAGQGKAPKQLVGQYLGLFINFTNDGGKLVNGFDLSKFGKMWITLGPDGKGVKLTSTWEIKNPLRTLLNEGLKLFQAVANSEISSTVFDDFEGKYMSASDSYAEDSVAVYDDFYYYDDEAPVAAEEAPAEYYY